MFEAIGVINPGVFLVGTILIILAPGPNSLYVLATATRRGVMDGYKAAAGVFLGDAVLMFLAAVGVDSLVRLYPVAFSVLQFAGAGYLGYLGLKIFYALLRKGASRDDSGTERKKEDPFYRALVLSLSNPKAILFFISFFVQFVNPGKGHPGMAFFVLACIVQVVSLTYLSILIFGGSRLASMVRGNERLQKAGSAVVGVAFLSFSCRLALGAISK